MKKFGEGQQPFYAIVDIPEGDAQELTTVTDQALNSLYGELFNLLKLHGINPTTTTSADLKQVARAVWSAVAAGNFYIDSGSENVKQLTHARASSYLFKNTNANDEAFTIEFLNKFANTGAVVVNVVDVENNQNHFNNIPLVLNNGEELQEKQLPANTVVKARYNTSINKFVLDITLSYAKYIFDGNQTQEDINKSTVKKFDTVQKMIDDLGLVDGAMVETAGYYTVNDGGGARYTISKTATDYSLPTKNGLNAVFCDSFDIRKFGIRNSATLDQTTEIQRMVNYADKFVYEIDFLNFSLMTPKITHFFTGRSTLVGMGFRKVHHLKNLTISNDKTVQLVQGTSPIMFLADDPNGRGLFKLSNIKFDPYVSNFKINNGEADGMMFGFYAGWHKDAGLKWPASDRFLTNYEIEFDNIEFLSPAISYNLLCGFFIRNIKANNVKGDYWGIMLCHHAYNLDVNNMHGIFRDDLHTGSGRLLVTNLIHEEAEIADDGVITRNNISVKNSSCYKKTDNSPYVVYKCHRIGSITINKFIGDNNIGRHEFYSGDNENDKRRLTIKNLEIKNIELVNFDYFACVTEVASYKNINVMNANIIDNAIFGSLTVDGVKVLKRALSLANGVVDSLIVKNIERCLDEVYGVVRSGAVIKTIELTNVTCNQDKLIECSFDSIKLDNVKSIITNGLNNFILSRSTNAVSFTTNNSQIVTTGGAIITHANNPSDKVEFNNTTLIGNLFYDVSSATPHVFNNCKLTKLFSCDPPSIPANSDVKVVLQFLRGARMGDTVVANFSNYNDNVVITASIFDADSIVVRFTNTSANPIDLPSGTLTVKIL